MVTPCGVGRGAEVPPRGGACVGDLTVGRDHELCDVDGPGAFSECALLEEFLECRIVLDEEVVLAGGGSGDRLKILLLRC